MNKMSKSVVFKLTAIMMCVTILGIAITVSVATTISGNVIVRESLGKVERNTEYEALKMHSWLTLQKGNLNTLSDVLATMHDWEPEELRRMFKGVIDQNETYSDVYMGFPDDTAILGSGFAIEELYDWWKATQRGWYQLAMSDVNRAHVTSPYIDTSTGDLCITISHAVRRGSQVAGVISIDILLPELQEMILSIDLGGDGYAMLLDSNGDIIIHPGAYAPNDNGEFQNLGTMRGGIYSNLWSQISAADGAYAQTDSTGIPKYYTSSTIETTGWHLVTVLPQRTVSQTITNIILIIIPITLVIAVIAGILIYITAKRVIAEPLSVLTGFMKKASATGDLSLSQSDVARIGKLSQNQDELGQCIGATGAFIGRITEVSKAMEIISNNDLTYDITLLSDKDAMGISLQRMIGNFNNMFSEIYSAAAQVASGSKQIADGAQALAQGSTEQAATVQQLSASVAEIADKTKENADMAGRAATLASTIKGSAEQGSRQMDEMMAAVDEITRASQSISKVIKVIDDIAFHTNILALNAAVEAARAGQHGKGFAVVADEVRNLASKSAEAAKSTGILITNSIEKSELGARIASETAASLVEIVSGIGESSEIVDEIARSSQIQSIGIAQVNDGIEQVAHVVQQNSATSEENAATSEQLNGQSDILANLISQFKLKGQPASGRSSGFFSAHQTPQMPRPMQQTGYALSDGGKY